MWFFKKREKQNIIKLIGFTDYHSHILPGVDDGVQTMDESLEILRLLIGIFVIAWLSIAAIILTINQAVFVRFL